MLLEKVVAAMPNHQKRTGPGESANYTRANTGNSNFILSEILGTVLAALIFTATLLTSAFGMSGGFDTGMDDTANVMAGLLTAGARKRLPPYAKQLKAGAGDTLWVCTGTEAWARAKSTTWMNGKKVVLPPGDDPDAYRWDMAGRFEDVVIVVDGQPPSIDTIKSLAIALMPHSDVVVYLDPKRNPVRFRAGRGA
jgi:hypothetical protein